MQNPMTDALETTPGGNSSTLDVAQTVIATGGYSTANPLPTDGQPAAPNAAAEMLKKTVLLQIECSKVGTSRSVSTDVVDSEADKDSVFAGKRLLGAKLKNQDGTDRPNPIKAIAKLDGEIKKYVREKCPPTMVKKSVFFVPIVKVNEVEKKLRQFALQRAALVAEGEEMLPQLIEHDREHLAELFNDSDYPTPAQFRGLFHFDWSYTTFGVPDILSAISEDIYQQEKGKQQAMWNEAHEMTQQLLRARALGLVEKMQERLAPGEDGKKKIFRNSLFANIQQFLDDFDALNITSDTELKAATETMRALLEGVDMAEIRKSDDARQVLQGQFAEIEAHLGTMVIEKPLRAITFEDDV